MTHVAELPSASHSQPDCSRRGTSSGKTHVHYVHVAVFSLSPSRFSKSPRASCSRSMFGCFRSLSFPKASFKRRQTSRRASPRREPSRRASEDVQGTLRSRGELSFRSLRARMRSELGGSAARRLGSGPRGPGAPHPSSVLRHPPRSRHSPTRPAVPRNLRAPVAGASAPESSRKPQGKTPNFGRPRGHARLR